MIVQKIKKNGVFGPDIPTELEYHSARLNEDGQTYTITFTEEQREANRITPAQGRAQLARDGKLAQIDSYIQNSDSDDLNIFWEYATFWDRTTPTIQQLATSFQIDLETFWQSAKKIQL